MSDVISSRFVQRTRKPHICCACCRTFPAGSPMHTQVCTDQGEIWTWRQCPTCQKLMAYNVYLDDEIPADWSHEMKHEWEFFGTMEEFLEYLKANYELPNFEEKRLGLPLRMIKKTKN